MDDLSKALREVTMFPFKSAVCTFTFFVGSSLPFTIFCIPTSWADLYSREKNQSGSHYLVWTLQQSVLSGLEIESPHYFL